MICMIFGLEYLIIVCSDSKVAISQRIMMVGLNEFYIDSKVPGELGSVGRSPT